MKKINKILTALESMAKTIINMQANYDTGRITLPKKMEGSLGQGYFAPWDYFTEEFYDIFNNLSKVEQEAFTTNIHKHKTLFACVKAGFRYNSQQIYGDWYSPVLEEDYYWDGEFHPDEYETELQADQERFKEFANANLKKNRKMLGCIIQEGTWTAACPGHRKVLRMKHHHG